jgi:hypothetical protein
MRVYTVFIINKINKQKKNIPGNTFKLVVGLQNSFGLTPIQFTQSNDNIIFFSLVLIKSKIHKKRVKSYQREGM